MTEPAPHFYVKPGVSSRGPLASGCAREGCGLPPLHPIHLRPAGDDPLKGSLATGTDGR